MYPFFSSFTHQLNHPSIPPYSATKLSDYTSTHLSTHSPIDPCTHTLTHLSFCLFTYSNHYSSFRPLIHPSIHPPFVHPSFTRHLSFDLPVYLSIHFPIRLFIYPMLTLLLTHPPTHPCIYLPIHSYPLPNHLTIANIRTTHLSIYPSIQPTTYPPTLASTHLLHHFHPSATWHVGVFTTSNVLC